MNAKHIKELLNAYQQSSITTEEKVFFVRFNELLNQYPDVFWKRSHYTPGHVTASAWVVNNDRTHTLLIHHKGAGMWFQPGGHIEAEDNSLFDAVLREVKEETNHDAMIPSQDIFDIDVHHIRARPERGEGEHDHFDIRILVEVPYEVRSVADDGVLDIKWCALNEVLLLNNTESLARMVRKTAMQ